MDPNGFLPPPGFGQQPPNLPGYGGYPPQPLYGAQPPYGPYPGQLPGYGFGLPPAPQPSPANMGARFGAFLIDWLLIAVPTGLLGVFSGAYHHEVGCDASGACTNQYNFSSGWMDLFAVVLGLAYSAYFVGVKTQSLGHRIAGIKVVDIRTGAPIGAGRGALRWLVLGVTGAICTLGFWSPFFDGPGDKVGMTRPVTPSCSVPTATRASTGHGSARRPGIAVRPQIERAAAMRIAGAAGLGVLAVQGFDPVHRHVPLCPFRALTGWYCPLCGSLRAVLHLSRLDVAAALHDNVLLVAATPIVALYWAISVLWPARMRTQRRLPAWTVATLVVLGIVFTIVRNLPAAAALRPS